MVGESGDGAGKTRAGRRRAADEKCQLVAERPRTSNEHRIAEPNGAFECADGFILITTFNDREFAWLTQAPGRADWSKDLRCLRSRECLWNRIAPTRGINAQRPTRTPGMERLLAAKVSCGPINEARDIECDPQRLARGMFLSLEQPVTGTVRTVRSPLRFSDPPVTCRRAPPLPGEQSEAALSRDHSHSDGDRRRLKDAAINWHAPMSDQTVPRRALWPPCARGAGQRRGPGTWHRSFRHRAAAAPTRATPHSGARRS